jgi:amino acid transporter
LVTPLCGAATRGSVVPIINGDPVQAVSQPALQRELGLLGACATNILNMVGVGPFLTIPLALSAMGGPQAMLGWILGAAIAICDGLVWAELGAAMPTSGGPYTYLLEAFGKHGLGKLMSFLFIWQSVVIAPLSIAGGAVGFGQYLRYLIPNLTSTEMKLVGAAVCLVTTLLLYRDMRSIGRLSIVMLTVVVGTMLFIVFGGATNMHWQRLTDFPPGAWKLSTNFFVGLGGATLIAAYDYGGYYNVCLIGGEVRRASRNIPLSILLAIGVVGLLYVAMTMSIISVVPWRDAIHSTAIVSDFTQKLYGNSAASVMTMCVLGTAFASVFAILLGFSRVPYAAAVDGRFFRAFARVHPTKRFPSFSLLTLGFASALACILDLESLIKALIVIQTMIQFMAQCVAVILIRWRRREIKTPFKMPFFPLPAILALLGWGYIVVSSGWQYILAGFALLVAGVAAYFWRARASESSGRPADWPFAA